jgi:NTP pyrophosphatase (non-canonical NTP hydrolase)
MNDRFDRLCRASVAKWGIAAQEQMLIEECAELIMAIAKVHRDVNGVPLQRVAEEMADVELMIHQIKMQYGLGKVVDTWRETKLDRLEQLLMRPL